MASSLSRVFRGRIFRNSSGVAAIELGMSAPVLLMFLLGIIEMGRMMWLQNALNYSVAEAARCASNNTTTCGTTTQIQNYAATQSGENFDSSVFTVTAASCGTQVSATYPMSLAIPYAPVSVTLNAEACYPS